MEKFDKKIYCSLDIETSGFDPLTNEILEVGFAFFTLDNKGLKITEEFTQVFKPSKPVGSQILGLTGISQKELEAAPKFSEFQKVLQDKLGGATIVGHNIVFDIKFLQAFGIKFSGKMIDTLDLVQWLLPTHHSYNLENLMHTFGISHKEAHRALADSKATIILLQKLLEVFTIFPESLKQEIITLIKPYNLEWKEFLTVYVNKKSLNKIAPKVLKKNSSTSLNLFKFEPSQIYNFALGDKYTQNVALSLQKSKIKSLLVLSKAQGALDLYKQGMADGLLVLPEHKFNKKNFEKLLKQKSFSYDELKFVLKILVWQKTNWQTETVSDLNLSFFGGQYKELVTGGEFVEKKSCQVIVCSQEVFLKVSSLGLFKDRQVVICGLNEFESAITNNLGTKSSWGYIIYLLKSFYNFELELGKEELKAPVEQGLAASDLFFGLINALLQTDPPSFQYYKISEETEYSENYQKIKGSAENYISKLIAANLVIKSDSISEFIANVQNFFLAEENKVKWIELAENRCVLFSMPLDIKELVMASLKPFKSLSFADDLGPEMLYKFFIKRLGLERFTLNAGSLLEKGSRKKVSVAQGDLFSGIKNTFMKKSLKLSYFCLPHTAGADEYLQILDKSGSLPAVVLFSSPMQVREFYEQNYKKLKEKSALLAQSHSGGGNKLLRNFGINPKSILLATDKFIIKTINGSSQVEQVEVLPVKTLVLSRLPFEQFTHPYQEAISKALPNAFMDYALPRALYNFHSLLKFFYSSELKDVYVIDAKLAKDYANVFKDYFKFLPGAESKA